MSESSASHTNGALAQAKSENNTNMKYKDTEDEIPLDRAAIPKLPFTTGVPRNVANTRFRRGGSRPDLGRHGRGYGRRVQFASSRVGVLLGTGRIRSRGNVNVDLLPETLRNKLQDLVVQMETSRARMNFPNTWLEEENKLLFFLKNVLKEQTGNSMPISQATEVL